MSIEASSGAWFPRIAIAALVMMFGHPVSGFAAEAKVAKENAPQVPTGSAAVTFNKDIAPLVFRHCAGCHRPGGVASFSLLSYHAVNKRTE